MVVGPHDISKTADVRVVEKGNDGCLTCGTNLFGLVGAISLCSSVMTIIWAYSWDDLACDLLKRFCLVSDMIRPSDMAINLLSMLVG
jgi:hypothetical protein